MKPGLEPGTRFWKNLVFCPLLLGTLGSEDQWIWGILISWVVKINILGFEDPTARWDHRYLWSYCNIITKNRTKIFFKTLFQKFNVKNVRTSIKNNKCLINISEKSVHQKVELMKDLVPLVLEYVVLVSWFFKFIPKVIKDFLTLFCILLHLL